MSFESSFDPYILKTMDLVLERMNERFDFMETRIKQTLSSFDSTSLPTNVWSVVRLDLRTMEREILTSDLGIYNESYRCRCLLRLDSLFLMIGDTIQSRPAYSLYQTPQQFYEREYDLTGSTDRIPSAVLRNIMYKRALRNKATHERNMVVPLFREVRSTKFVQEKCPICLDSFCDIDNHNKTYLVCTHHFHQSCIVQWIATQKFLCPVCKHDMFVL
jgi:hypothetical protein